MPRVVPSQIISFIDGHFAFARLKERFNVDLQFKDRVSALLRLVDELPDELVAMTGPEYNRFVEDVETMRSTIELWNAHGALTPNFDVRLGSAITDLRRCVAEMDDQLVPASTAGLLFIKDNDLRESVRRDIASAKQAFHDSEWKGATVLGGAVVEVLLLWAINEQPRSHVKASFAKLQAAKSIAKSVKYDPDYWSLEIYKLIAADLGVIKGDTIKLVELAQGFRNLIHPGRANRLKEQCNLSTAHAALAAMERLIEQFS